jgi:hypothetical protein
MESYRQIEREAQDVELDLWFSDDPSKLAVAARADSEAIEALLPSSGKPALRAHSSAAAQSAASSGRNWLTQSPMWRSTNLPKERQLVRAPNWAATRIFSEAR